MYVQYDYTVLTIIISLLTCLIMYKMYFKVLTGDSK